MVNWLNRHHLPLNSATFGWKKEESFATSLVWRECFTNCKGNIDDQEFDIVAKNELDIEDSKDQECVLSGEELGGNSDIN